MNIKDGWYAHLDGNPGSELYRENSLYASTEYDQTTNAYYYMLYRFDGSVSAVCGSFPDQETAEQAADAALDKVAA